MIMILSSLLGIAQLRVRDLELYSHNLQWRCVMWFVIRWWGGLMNAGAAVVLGDVARLDDGGNHNDDGSIDHHGSNLLHFSFKNSLHHPFINTKCNPNG